MIISFMHFTATVFQSLNILNFKIPSNRYAHMRFGFLPTHETHLCDCIISLRVQVCSLRTILTMLHFNEVFVSSWKRWVFLYICVRSIDLASVCTDLSIVFGTVPKVFELLYSLYWWLLTRTWMEFESSNSIT